VSPRPAEQLSVPYFPSDEGLANEGQAFLFTRDLSLGVMPIGGSRNRPEYTAKLQPEDAHLTLLLANLLDPDAQRGELAEALVEFVETATQYLAHFGEVFYETVPIPRATGGDGASEPTDTPSEDQTGDKSESEPSDELPPIARLVTLPRGKVWRVLWRHVQVIPKADRERIGKRLVPIPSARIWHLKLPTDLGSPPAHRRLLKRLGQLDPLRPEFAMEIGDMGRSVDFDFSVQRAACDIEQERSTKAWGRIPSITHIDGTTEYLFLARIVQWRRTQAVIREHVITQLNHLLDRLDVGHCIVTSGLPSAEEIGEALRQMRAGEITVAEAMHATRL